MVDLSLFGSYTHSNQILYLSQTPKGYIYISELILILVSDLYFFRSPIGVTELILILRSLHLFGGTRRYQRDYGMYTGITELILI